MKIRPLHNHVVIKQQEESESQYGNIIVPDMGKDKPLIGEVLSVGPGLITSEGLIPMSVRVGEIVAFSSFGGQKISIKGDEFIIMKDPDILVVLESSVNDLPVRMSEKQLTEILIETENQYDNKKSIFRIWVK